MKRMSVVGGFIAVASVASGFLCNFADGDDGSTYPIDGVTPISKDEYPSLTLKSVSPPNATVKYGEPFKLEYDVENQSRAASAEPAVVAFLLTKGGKTIARLGSTILPELPARTGCKGTVELAIPEEVFNPGYGGATAGKVPVHPSDYDLQVVFIPEMAVPDIKEVGNVATVKVKVSVGGGPTKPTCDLGVHALSAPSHAAPGATITVSDITTNCSGATSSSCTTWFWLSTTSNGPPYKYVKTDRTIPAIAVGSSWSWTGTMKIPASTAYGSYFLVDHVNHDGVNTDGNLANDKRSVPFTVP